MKVKSNLVVVSHFGKLFLSLSTFRHVMIILCIITTTNNLTISQLLFGSNRCRHLHHQFNPMNRFLYKGRRHTTPQSHLLCITVSCSTPNINIINSRMKYEIKCNHLTLYIVKNLDLYCQLNVTLHTLLQHRLVRDL